MTDHADLTARRPFTIGPADHMGQWEDWLPVYNSLTVTDDRGREASYELPDEVGRKFVTNEALSRAEYENWLCTPDTVRRTSGALRLAVLDVFEEKPVQVGHLATTPNGDEVLVLHIGQHCTFFAYSDGRERIWENDVLTYSRPKPEGWGQQ